MDNKYKEGDWVRFHKYGVGVVISDVIQVTTLKTYPHKSAYWTNEGFVMEEDIIDARMIKDKREENYG